MSFEEAGDQKMKIPTIVTLLALALMASASPANAMDRRSAVPVMIAPYLDSYDDHGNVIPETNCSSTGTVKVDDFLALKTGPGVDFPRIAKLPNLQMLIICNGQHDGWPCGVAKQWFERAASLGNEAASTNLRKGIGRCRW